MADYGWGHERANYGEHPGTPSTEEAFVYAKTLLSPTMRYKHPEGKLLIIGGGIANPPTWRPPGHDSDHRHILCVQVLTSSDPAAKTNNKFCEKIANGRL
eukprot:12745587-Heterocapsa_arctica.AAC.1